MERKPLSMPEIGLIAGTRAAIGAGLGLLLADRMDKRTRAGVGWTLLAVGAITTIPIAIQLLSKSPSSHPHELPGEFEDDTEEMVEIGETGESPAM